MINFEDIKNTNAPSLREAVTTFFREAILTGDLQAGDLLPSSRELAKHLDTSYPNVHHGLTPLVKEGLILRDRKKGTIVQARKRKIECIVIYAFVTSLDDSGPFQHLLTDIISSKLKTQGITPRLVVDNNSHYGLKQIQEWAERGQIQGVVMPRTYTEEAITTAMKRLPVPVTYPGAKNSVMIDWSNLNDLALQGLKNQNCKTVGIISSIEYCDAAGHENEFYNEFKEKAKKHGLETQAAWLEAVDSKDHYLKTSEMAMSFAYNACDRLLNLPQRPDGIFVFSDNLIAGVMMAMMKNNINIPNDIKLVLHRNWEVEIPLFKPCVVIGLSIEEVANALIDNIFTQFNGDKPQKTMIKYEAKKFEPELQGALEKNES